MVLDTGSLHIHVAGYAGISVDPPGQRLDVANTSIIDSRLLCARNSVVALRLVDRLEPRLGRPLPRDPRLRIMMWRFVHWYGSASFYRSTSTAQPAQTFWGSCSYCYCHNDIALDIAVMVFEVRSFRRSSGLIPSHSFKVTTAATRSYKALPLLPSSSLSDFRVQAFAVEQPCLLHSEALSPIPAISRWFKIDPSGATHLDVDVLTPYGDVLLATELTAESSEFPSPHASSIKESKFYRAQLPLSAFLSHVAALQSATTSFSTDKTSTDRLYIAQTPLADLPAPLQADLPVRQSSLVQVEVMSTTPASGLALRRRILRCTKTRTRICPDRMGMDEDMMHGERRRAFEERIWGMESESLPGFEVEVNAGDAVFIPKGWWHSVKGVGSGIVGSVNWWFR
ncbi:hypothetical protein MRB53_039548 [Persea americana]|nr:hypothetical protein MRB53_039548 [Persea americana]